MTLIEAEDVHTSWYESICGYDLSNARLKYSEEDDGFLVFDYDLGDRDVSFYLDPESKWLCYAVENGFLETGAPYQVVRQIGVCDSKLPDVTFRNSILEESGVTFDDQEEPEPAGPALDLDNNHLQFSTVDIYLGALVRPLRERAAVNGKALSEISRRGCPFCRRMLQA